MTKYISLNLAKASDQDRIELKAQIVKALESMEGLWGSSLNAQKSMDSWPNIAQEFNRARLVLKSEMKAFNGVINFSIEQLRELSVIV